MGASHVSACYAQWSHLPDRPFRLLTYMALIAKDATPEPTFWGGRDAMCLALGLDPDPISYRVARRAVRSCENMGVSSLLIFRKACSSFMVPPHIRFF